MIILIPFVFPVSNDLLFTWQSLAGFFLNWEYKKEGGENSPALF